MIIEIVSDSICPWCFIGKRRLERALAERPIEDLKIGWRPFQLNPDMPAGGMSRSEYLERKFGGKEGARQVYDPIKQAGEGEGIDFAFHKMEKTPNTINSHRLIRRSLAHDLQDAVVEALFRAYFLDGADIEDPATLAAIAASAGMDEAETLAYLESDEDVETVRAEDVMARQMGIQGVPCFIVDRKYMIPGAADPAVFHQVFDKVAEDQAAAAPAE